MEPQSSNDSSPIQPTDESQIIDLIVRTFKGKNQQEVSVAEQQIIESLNHPGVLQAFVKILTANTQPRPNIKKATALIIKKYSYECAQSPGQKPLLVQNIYRLLLSQQLQFAAKQVLGTALQHLIVLEKHSQYKKIIVNNTLQLLSLENGLSKFDGCLIVLSACFNTDGNIESQLQFFKRIFEVVAVNAMKLINWIKCLTEDEWKIHHKSTMTKIVKFFDVLDQMVEQLTATYYHDMADTQVMWQNQLLVELLHSYLLLFNNNGSIISTSYSRINEVKKTILNIILSLYKESQCPQAIFKTIYFTFLAEAQTVVNNFEVEEILIKCITLLESHLQRNLYSQIFASNKLQTIFAILLYSVTNHEQYQLIEQNPEKFVELAQDYTQANPRSEYLKVKAANLLQTIVSKIDEALRNILQIVLMISSEVLQKYKGSEILVAQIKQVFNKYTFYRLSEELKFQTCLMIIANLSVHILKRADLKELVTAFFMTHFNTIITITPNLVVLRIMRAVSYFPIGLYFLYIQMQMSKQKVFVLQGIKSFERILRTNRYPQIMKVLANIFSNLIGVLKINDPIMQLMILNCYDSMLKVSNELYRRCRNKIKQQFFINKDVNYHASLTCFNFIYSLLVKQKQQRIRNELISQFYEITVYLMMPQNQQLYFKYQQNLIEIFTLIISLRSFTSPQIQNFVEKTFKFLSRYQKGSSIFKLYNSYILHLQGAVFKLQHYYQCFWQELKIRVQLSFQDKGSLSAVPYFCFLMSQIISNNTVINLSESELEELLRITEVVPPQFKQYFLLIFLSFVYQNPAYAVKYLRGKGIYEGFLLEVMKVQFDGLLTKKILILALIRLIEVEQNFNTFKIILNYCLQYLKLQSKRSRGSGYAQRSFDIKPRSLGQQRATITYAPIDEEHNDNQLINLFVNFKHPYRTLSQFDNFKVILEHRHGFLKQLSPEILADIKEILQTQWIDSKTRKIVKVMQ